MSEPLAIDTGLAEDWQPAQSVRFMGLELEIAPDVLVPRRETELLAMAAIDLLQEMSAGAIVVDMCCGSGNLALAIAMAFPAAKVWASDLTDSTVSLARRNAKRYSLFNSVKVAQGDLFSSFEGEGLEGQVDLIVCNPPYISSSRLEGDRAFLLQNEPREAFDGGPYGLSIHQRLVREAPAFLKPGGWLACEFGEGQHRQIKILLERTGIYEPACFVEDAAGTPRVAMARKKYTQ